MRFFSDQLTNQLPEHHKNWAKEIIGKGLMGFENNFYGKVSQRHCKYTSFLQETIKINWAIPILKCT